MSEEQDSWHEKVLEITVAALHGIQDCIIAGEIDTPEYKLYKNSIYTGLTYFENKQRDIKNAMDASKRRPSA